MFFPFGVLSSPSLPEDVRRRVVHLAGRRITREGELLIEAREFRTQEQNRAAAKPRRRHKTKPMLASKQRRLETKRRRGAVKRLRQGAE